MAGTLSINERNINSLDQNQHPQISLHLASPPLPLLNTHRHTLALVFNWWQTLYTSFRFAVQIQDQTLSIYLSIPCRVFTISLVCPFFKSPFKILFFSFVSSSHLFLCVSLPVGVNNLTTELLQSWLRSRPQIGTVCLFMTLCCGAHVWDVQKGVSRCMCFPIRTQPIAN